MRIRVSWKGLVGSGQGEVRWGSSTPCKAPRDRDPCKQLSLRETCLMSDTIRARYSTELND
jgi:hypothetical protein